jgi:hypothetical protein
MSWLKWVVQLVAYAPQLISVWFKIQSAIRKAQLEQVANKLKEAKTDEEREQALSDLTK